MKKIHIFTAIVVLFTSTLLTSCNGPVGPYDHDGCTTCGDGNGQDGSSLPVCQFEPYTVAIVTTFSFQSAFQNDGSDYAKTEIGGYVAQGPASTYKAVQGYVLNDLGYWETAQIGVDNHASSGSQSMFQNMKSACTTDLLQLMFDSQNRVTDFNETGSYMIINLKTFPNPDGTVRMAGSTNASANETDYSHPVSVTNPEKLKLDISAGFPYEATGYQKVTGNVLFRF